MKQNGSIILNIKIEMMFNEIIKLIETNANKGIFRTSYKVQGFNSNDIDNIIYILANRLKKEGFSVEVQSFSKIINIAIDW